MIPAWVVALFKMVTEGFGLINKAIPPDEIRIEKHEEKKDLREQDNKQDEIIDDFNFIKDDLGYDAWDYLKDVHPTMTNEERITRHKILLGMIKEFRQGIVKRRGVKWRKYRDWLAENNK
jgi:hypothetical protein